MIEIPLTKGLVAFIDEEDAPIAVPYKWHAQTKGNGRTAYAVRSQKSINGKRQPSISLHRAIMNPPPELFVDHINRNGLDCRRSNMRLATPSQNCTNSIRPMGKNRFRGVKRSNASRFNIWYAMISVGGIERSSCCFSTQEEAAMAYDAMAVQFHGEFAVLNFPERQTESFKKAQEIVAQEQEDAIRFSYLAKKFGEIEEFRRKIDEERSS